MTRPAYIPATIASNDADDNVSYEWDEYDPYAPIGAGVESTFWLLDDRAPEFAIAYTLVMAEWCVYRFADIAQEPLVTRFLAASWKALDVQSDLPEESDEDAWQGPKRMAVDMALMNVLNAFYQAEEETPSNIAAFNEALALHILPQTDEFVAWSDQLKSRLTELPAKTPFSVSLFQDLLK